MRMTDGHDKTNSRFSQMFSSAPKDGIKLFTTSQCKVKSKNHIYQASLGSFFIAMFSFV